MYGMSIVHNHRMWQIIYLNQPLDAMCNWVEYACFMSIKHWIIEPNTHHAGASNYVSNPYRLIATLISESVFICNL